MGQKNKKPLIGDLSKTNIAIFGAGTVGNRDLETLASLGFQVIFSKYGASSDIKLEELLEVQKRLGQKLVGYAARGSNLNERIDAINKAGFDCQGSVDDIDYDKVDLVIDATNNREERNWLEIYGPHNLAFAINGGSQGRIVNNLFYAGVPKSVVDENHLPYLTNNAKIVSCNTHCMTTAIGLLKETLDSFGRDFKEYIKHIDTTFNRRHEDPNKGKSLPWDVTVTRKPYHLEEVAFLQPETKGLLGSDYSKWATEYFHNISMDIDFKKSIPDDFVDAFKLAIQIYPRAIYTEDDLSHKKTIVAAAKANIPDGDIPFPVYMVRKIHDTRIKIYALTPQRGIVTPSTADYAIMRTQQVPWKEAFEYVNSNALFRGHNFLHIANSVQDNLRQYNLTKAEENILLKQWVKGFKSKKLF